MIAFSPPGAPGRRGPARRAVAAALAAGLCGGAAVADAQDSVTAALARAREEAARWQPAAELVQVQLTGFGFATDRAGMPDVTQSGPPRLAMFMLVAASAPHAALRVSVRMNEPALPAPPQPSRGAAGGRPVMVDVLPRGAAPAGPAIPRDVPLDFGAALERARRDVARECAGAPSAGGCGLVSDAELRMHRRDARDVAAWTIAFGQHPRLADDVSRVVDAASGAILARNVRSRFPSGTVAAIRATVTALRFALGEPRPATAGGRRYDDLFFYNAARDVQWELNLIHPAPGRRTAVTVQAVWQLPGGGTHREPPRTFTVEGEATSSRWTGGGDLRGTKRVAIPSPVYAMCESERRQEEERRRQQGLPPVGSAPCARTQAVDIQLWSIGGYRVDLFADGQRIASGAFAMRAKEDVWAEVQARVRDRAAPTNEIGYAGARVAALRFFAEEAAPRAPRAGQYASRFALPGLRRVGWELELRHEPPGRWLDLPIRALLFHAGSGGERLVQRTVLQSAVPADAADTRHGDAFGWDDAYFYDRTGASTPSPRAWLPGAYRVELFLGGDRPAAYKIAAGTFEVR